MAFLAAEQKKEQSFIHCGFAHAGMIRRVFGYREWESGLRRKATGLKEMEPRVSRRTSEDRFPVPVVRNIAQAATRLTLYPHPIRTVPVSPSNSDPEMSKTRQRTGLTQGHDWN